ncbi:MAG: hypothetical protein ACXIT4_00985 [Erythrobacter sp.]
MPSSFLATFAPLLLVQAAPDAAVPPAGASAPITDLSQVPITEATAPRCAIAFALVSEWQQAGEAKGRAWPDMIANGGQEFFVVAMAQLMDDRDLDRAALVQVIARETERLKRSGDDAIAAMMPGCLMIKQSAGL